MNKLINVGVSLILIITIISCVKDVDLDQTENVVLAPVVELNLIYLNLSPSDFSDPETGLPVLTLRDTTEIRFLDDPDISESIRRADFYFRFANSVASEFNVEFSFLSESLDTTYVTQTIVAMGTKGTTSVTEFEEIVLEPEIFDLTRANRVVVSVTLPDADPSLEGNLNLQSKTTYYLEIRDRE